MTNKEKYRDEIEDIIFSNTPIAVVGGKIFECADVHDCESCSLFDKNSLVGCSFRRRDWLASECKGYNMNNIREILLNEIRDRRKYENGCSESFAEIGYNLYGIVQECIKVVSDEEYKI